LQERGVFHGADEGLRAFLHERLQFGCVAADDADFFTFGEQRLGCGFACISCGSGDYDHGDSFVRA
jgi:hypothetical protein